jgi:glycosyltransferase involved in cell wall biosynthesis
MSTPTVSVIIPTYNCEAYIRETIDSILDQTFQEFELIVVDDGSTDGTQGIVESYGAQVRLVRQSNAGVCVARNRGIREARGKYICLMDHDDFWFPDKLATQARLLEGSPETGVVFSEFTLWHPDPSGHFPAPLSFAPPPDSEQIDPEYSGWIYHQFLLDCWMLTSTAMFRADVFKKCGTFDESLPYSEDWELWLRISREYPFLKLSRSTTLYRQHPNQGNRLVRPVDYRTVLLESAFRRWGLASRDGRAVTRRQFMTQLARYHAGYGLHQLQSGHFLKAITSFGKAWITNPAQIKYPAYGVAALLGWRPK